VSSKKIDDNNRISIGSKHLGWVPVAQMRISERAQRAHNSPASRKLISHIADHFDPDLFETPVVNLRDGVYYVMEGGHRYLALVEMGYEDQQVQCWVYTGLSEAEEAGMFLSLNDKKAISGMAEFKIALVAGRLVQCDIERIVLAAGLKIGNGHEAIGCVSALTKTYHRGAKVLQQTVETLYAAYGYAGFSSKVVEATGMFLATYEGQVDLDRLKKTLAGLHLNVTGLLQRGEKIRLRYGHNQAVSIAAAMVEVYNFRAPRDMKLNGWWSTLDAA
jgi:hypothetical protein